MTINAARTQVISTTRRPFLRAVTSTVVAFALAISGVALTGVAAANALDPATVTVTKTSNNTTPSPGEVFAYTLNYTCSSPTTDCANAVIVDTIPDEFVIVSGSANPVLPSNATATVVGQTVTVVFTDDIDGPDPGLASATGGSVGIQVQMRSDILPARDGDVVTNTATMTADNSPTSTNTADVTLDVPQNVAVTGSKSFSPTAALFQPGVDTTVTLNAANTSNVPATTLVISDPADRAAGPGAFDYLDFVSFGACALPSGATSVRVDAYNAAGTLVTGVDGATPALPAGVAAADVTGLVFTFTGDIAVGATVSCAIVTEQRATNRTTGASLVTGVTVSNTAKVDLTTEFGDTTVTPAPATYTINPLGVAVTGSKSFTPNSIVVPNEEDVRVTLGGRNTSGTTLDTLTISEPEGFLDGDNFTFDSWVDADATWPAGATSASIQWFTASGTVSGGTIVQGDTLPSPPANVRGFSITYSGSIANSATVSLPFMIKVAGDTVDAGDTNTFTNTATVDGSNVAGNAQQAVTTVPLTVTSPMVEVASNKSFTPTQLISQPGRRTVATLEANTNGSTVPANTITIQDPAVGTSAEFYRFFDARSVTLQPIPADVNAQIYVAIGDPSVEANWRLIDEQHGPTLGSYSSVFADSAALTPAELGQIQGVRIVETKDSGAVFPNPTTVRAEVSYAIRSTPRSGAPLSEGPHVLENCAVASATGQGADSGPSEPICADFTLVVAPAPGDGISKWWDDPALAITRSHDQADAELGWRVGTPGATSAQVSDPVDPTVNVATTTYEAFDLVSIKPITRTYPAPAGSVTDGFIQYDQVSNIELYNGVTDSWVSIYTDACTPVSKCQGQFAGYTLTAAQRAFTEGVRFTFTEYAGARTNNTFPALGAGVGYGWPAACNPFNDPENTGQVGASEDCLRHIGLTFEVRDDRRSDGTPVTEHEFYNYVVAGANIDGTVNNTTRLVIDYPGADQTLDGWDTISLQDPLPATAGTKTWTPSTVTLPAPTDPYPTSNLALTGYGTGTLWVDTLTIADPTSGTNPFDVVTVTDIASITTPTGAVAADTVVTLTRVGGATTEYTEAEALALTATDLADVVGVSIEFSGRIQPGAANRGGITLATQVRTTHRDGSTFEPGPTGFVNANTSTVTTTDEGISPNGVALEVPANLTILPSVSGTTASKTFSPTATNIENPVPVTVRLEAGLTGTVNKKTVVLTDQSPTFYNVFDLTSVALTTAPAGATDIQVDCRVDTFSGSPIVVTPGAGSTGGWYLGTATGLPLASDFSALFPTECATIGSVTGIRITFTGSSITGTSAVVTLNAAVRDTLRTGEATGSTVSPTPNPDETELGAVTNVLTVDAIDTQDKVIAQTSNTKVFSVNAGTASVQVSKTSTSQVYPSIAVPYSLKFTNNGTGSITSPVVVDRLPADLVYDETTMAPSYSSSLGAAGIGNGTISYDPVARTLTYTWPAGASIAVGETVTITQPLRVAPGTTSGTTVTNSVGITSDRVFTSCTKDATTSIAATYDAAGNFCNITAPVLVQTDGGYVVTKDVKGAAGTATNVVNAATPCLAASGGYYRYPCGAGSTIDGVDNWRINLTNAGNLPGSQLVVIDVLPHAGDSQVLSTSTPRGSTFRPVFDGNLVLNEGNVPASNIAMTTYYSTSDTPCRNDLYLGTNPPCAAGDWIEYVEGTTDVTLVKSLKFVFDFANTTTPGELPPTAEFSVTYDTKNTHESAANPDGLPVGVDTTSQEQAWNSVAIGASFRDGNFETRRDPLDSRKAGVVFGDGSIQIVKVRDGEGAIYAPTSYEATVTCTYTNGGDTLPVALANGGVVTLDEANEYTVRFDGIPLGSVCETVESGTLGSYGESARTVSGAVSPATVADGEEVPAASITTITNTFDVASLQVTKLVSTDATVGTFGDFHVEVTCTIDGDVITFDDGRLEFDIVDGQTVTVNGLPLGAECGVVEDETGGADTVLYSVDGGTRSGTGTTEIDADGSTVLVDNSYGAGQLAVTKTVTGEGGDVYGTGPFTVHVYCTYGTPTQVLYDADLAPIYGGDTITLPELFPAGTACVVTETKTGGATTPTVGPGVSIVDGETVTVDVTNDFEVGTLRIDKLRVGSGVADFGAGPFEVQAICTYLVDGVEVTAPLPDAGIAILDEENDYSTTFDDFGIPVGAECVITETDAGGALEIEITPNNGTVTIDADEQAVVTVTNTFYRGELTITKVVDKSIALVGDTLTYSITVTNTSPELTAEDVVVTDTLPAGVSFVSASNLGVLDGNTITWTIASLEPGESVTLKVVAKATAVGTAINRATVINPEGPWVPPVVENQCSDDATQTCAKTVVGTLALTGMQGWTGGLVGWALALIILGGAVLLLVAYRRRAEEQQ